MLRLLDGVLRLVILVDVVHALDRWAALRSDSGAVWAVQLAGTVGMPCSSRSLCLLSTRQRSLSSALHSLRAHLNITGFISFFALPRTSLRRLYTAIVLYYGWTGGRRPAIETCLALILAARSALTVG